MNIEKSYTYIAHQYFYAEIECGRKPWNYFYYMSLRITFIGSTNFLCSLVATGRRLRPPIFSGYNLSESPTPEFSGYNQKEPTTPYVLCLQPEVRYNHLSFPRPFALKYKFQMMKPLPHCHCELYHCKPVPTTCNQPIPLTYNQHVHVFILYQQKPTGT
jgi:hypothetical protein